jgi:hypothetical protein
MKLNFIIFVILSVQYINSKGCYGKYPYTDFLAQERDTHFHNLYSIKTSAPFRNRVEGMLETSDNFLGQVGFNDHEYTGWSSTIGERVLYVDDEDGSFMLIFKNRAGFRKYWLDIDVDCAEELAEELDVEIKSIYHDYNTFMDQ